MEVIDTGQDSKIQLSVVREMILNKYLFQANKMVTKQNRLIVIGLVILRHTMSNLSLAFLYTPSKKKKKKKKKTRKYKKADQ